MDENQQKQQISIAFVHTIASHAGFKLADMKVDDDSVDLMVAATGLVRKTSTLWSPLIALQLKCTSKNCVKKDHISFRLNLKNYQDLCQRSYLPRYLVVLVLPSERALWMEEDEERMISRKCAFYYSLANAPPTQNATGETLQIPRSQRFTVETLEMLMYQASEQRR